MRCVRPDLTTSSNSRAFASRESANPSRAGRRPLTSSSSAARCTAEGKTSLDDWPMLTSSFAWTSAPARAAITSFAFMFEDVPDPVWNTSIGNWSSNSPFAMRSPAAAIRSALSRSRRPRSAFTRAEAALIRPSQRATETGMGSPETGKFSTALRVSVPQSSFGVVATPWSLNGAQSPEAQLRRALAQGLAHRLGEVGDQRPAEIAALGALARVEALGALALDGPERAAMEALDGVLLAHTVFFGCGGPPVLPPKGEIRQSVEYLGWTF